MAQHKVCDRCGNKIDTAESFLSMNRWERPRFFGALRRKNKELWTEFPQEMDFCDQCTKDFFKLVKVTKELK